MTLSSDKSHHQDLGGTIRSRTAAQTLAWLLPMYKKLGITRVANITGLDCLNIPVALCIRPNSKHLGVSQGKGLTWELAAISAVMETIEAYHAENPAAPVLQGSYQDLAATHAVMDPHLFANDLFTIAHLERRSLAWAAALELNSQKSVLIPHVLSHLDSTLAHPEYSFLAVSSNGLAAGNTLEEATCHALYEIIERDSLWHWAKLSLEDRYTTQLKIETITSVLNQELIAKILQGKQAIKIWDITSKVGIPSFHCVIYETNPVRRLNMFTGTGTHLVKEIALSRAITEAAQARLTLISGSRDDIFIENYQKNSAFNYEAQEYSGCKDYADCLAPKVSSSFTEDIAILKTSLAAQGFEQIFLLDHTKEDLNIPVAHVFIPGMKYRGARM